MSSSKKFNIPQKPDSFGTFTSDYMERLKKREQERVQKEQERLRAEYLSRQEGGVQLATQESNKAASDTASVASDESYGKGYRWGVLAGVNKYVDPLYPSLNVCVKDAQAIYTQLVAGGFDQACIHLLCDTTALLPNRAEILASLAQAAKIAQRDDLLLFYYSGHGAVEDGVSYLIARDGRSHALKHTAIALPDVANILQTSQARAKVIILDACHAGANFEGKGPQTMPPDFIERVFAQAKGYSVLASCEQGQVSYEWSEQKRSVFTHFLLDALKGKADQDAKGFVTVQDISRYVTNGVRKWAFANRCSQTPTLQGMMAGDIILTWYGK